MYPAGAKFPKPDTLATKLSEQDWLLSTRATGGAPVPQMQGVLNASYLFNWPKEQSYSTKAGYNVFCGKLQAALTNLGIHSQCHATPGSYCDGDFNINISGQKLIGTAQRVVLNGAGGYIVLAQAFILVDADIRALCNTVNLCYEHIEWPERILESAHTCLAKHLTTSDSLMNDLCFALGNSFST